MPLKDSVLASPASLCTGQQSDGLPFSIYRVAFRQLLGALQIRPGSFRFASCFWKILGSSRMLLRTVKVYNSWLGILWIEALPAGDKFFSWTIASVPCFPFLHIQIPSGIFRQFLRPSSIMSIARLFVFHVLMCDRPFRHLLKNLNSTVVQYIVQ